MEKNLDNDLCSEIIEKSMFILRTIGSGMYKYNSSTGVDDYYGVKYSHAGLSISYYDNEIEKKLYITTGGVDVLHYTFGKEKVIFIDGPWIEDINRLYQQIIKACGNKYIIDKIKLNELEGLSEYFKLYVLCSKKHNTVTDKMNYELANNSFRVGKKYRNVLMYDVYNGKHYNYSMEYVLYYDKEAVAEFHDNIFEVFPNMDYFISKYKQGDWRNIFKTVMTEVRSFEKEETKKSINKVAEEVTRRLKQ